ncbi:hypothetical protein [Carboxylicivirga marina]|uniref:Uncharacterized protein n=1 Tax=Carboxylicivirga marina TaxID=2800988 RepID=A0ABS1HEP0_9BACT|nr:hypothetical protein [Carboxylicivirga marina]MBK3516119.1 hypothetical protein [Carboxylicivirga marina]
MKEQLSAGRFLFLICLTSICLAACNPGSNKAKKNQTSSPQQGHLIAKIEGVFEYLTPNQGIAIMLKGRYIYIYSESDDNMYCHSGIYKTSGEIITNTILFSPKSEDIGKSFQWKVLSLSGDTLLAAVLDDDGNIVNKVRSLKKVAADDHLIQQMNEFEGTFNYVPPLTGQGIMLQGYYVYMANDNEGNNMGHGGTYIQNQDTFTNMKLYNINKTINSELRWIGKMKEDTIVWAVINDANQKTWQGYSLKIR